MSRLIFVAFLLIPLIGASCSSCESCGTAEEAKSTDAADVAEAKEADVAEDTRAQMLEKARENAGILGDQAAFDRVTKARFMAAELEGMVKEKEVVEAPKVKRREKPKVEDKGQLDVAKLKAVFRNNQGTLRKCYERAAKTDPALQGKVVMTIRIGRGGKASLVKARSQEIGNDVALDCMERAAKQWNYPAPSGGTVMVSKTFRFTPQN